MLDEEESAELRGLRARAFGADADIQDDPVALARWAELEDRARVTAPPAPAASPSAAPPASTAKPPATADEGEITPEAAEGPTESGDAAPAAASEHLRPHRIPAWRRRSVLLAALPIVAIVFTVAYLLGSSVATVAGGTASPVPRTGTALPPVLLPLDEDGVRQMYADYPGRITLSLVARLDGANLWWVTADGGATTCLAVDTAYGISSSCAPTSRVVDGIGVGVDFGPGQPIAYWVTPGGTPYIEVGSDIDSLAAEHLSGPPPSVTPTPSPTP
ncbi:hypothetical protein [Microbacterium candidum]|uniref:Anti-sigma factor n=1 Tax=Microbacterium candidum TaxID=3041922 RepID=A0ABT7N0J8_9MICO|nr:hypothetical protein [Microbacterium sp. ASV49]MDL9980190.1 hypothetical protein [Microbacterium sp. ASV49]